LLKNRCGFDRISPKNLYLFNSQNNNYTLLNKHKKMNRAKI